MEWFRRFADVPNVGYIGNSAIDRQSLPGYNAVPKDFASATGKEYDILTWPNGTTSPASVRGAAPAFGTEAFFTNSAHKSLQRMYEALELPGTLSDYHFVIQNCCQQLWDYHMRRKDPWVYNEIEKLSWLDIRLVEAYPEIVKFNGNDGTVYATIVAFSFLISLYKQEGYLHEALDVAKRAVKFDQLHYVLEELMQKVSMLEAEDVE